MSTTAASTSAAPISFAGLSSGLDTTSIVKELVALDSQPLTSMQNQQTALQTKEQIFGQLGSYLQSFKAASDALNTSSTWNSVTPGSSNSAVATISAGSSSPLPGSFNLTVNQLATAQKLVSSAQTDATSALGMSGTLEINGKSVSVAANQSLTSIAQSINNLNAGVTAGIVNGGQGNVFLSMTSTQTGVANKIQMADISGSVLQSLGIANGVVGVRSTSGAAAISESYSSSSGNLQSLIGATTAGSFTVNGTSVAVDFSTDSLQSIATKINGAGAGATATVVPTTSSGTTTYQLQITGSNGTVPTFVDGGNVLQSLGILQQGASNELVKGLDASFTLDKATITSPTNTVTTAIPGATITLLQGTPTSPGTTTLSLTPSTAAATSALQNFVSSYNQVADYIAQNSQIDTTTFATGALFGDSTANQISTQLTNTLFQNVAGLSGPYNNLTSIGLTLNQTGDLSLDTNKLTSALTSNPAQVQQLFEATGTGSNSNISYIASTVKTQASSGSGYPVNITQLATKASYVASTPQTSPSGNAESLTFGGALLGKQNYTLITQIGATLQDTVNQINSDSKLSELLTASITTDGKLRLDSKLYGTPGNFTIQSDQAAGADDTGVGNTLQTPTTAGVDVAGTINGEAATGSGQLLTGATGNANTSGLEISYTGATTGAVGTMSFSTGMAAQLSNLLKNFTDPAQGLIANANNGLQSEYTSIGKDITDLNAQLASESANLTAQFNAMEQAISQLKAQSQSLTAMISSLTGTTSTTSSSSGSTGSSSSSGTASTGG